jgi:nitrogen fixation/metabolism regulation signal transduction histidine kinase
MLGCALLAVAVDRATTPPATPATAATRSVQLIGRRGSVLASRELVAGHARCAPRVQTLHLPEADAQLVLTFEGDCEPAPRRAASIPWGALVVAGLGAALAAGLSARTRAAGQRRLATFAAAAERVGTGDLTVRVRPPGGELDPLAGAFNQMVEELQLSRERVDYLQRLAGWQDVARRLAHEIKNPLTPIQLAVQEIARKYTGEDARYKRALETAREVVEEEVGTLRRLVTAFSEFARLPDVKPAAADLAEFVRDIGSSRQFLDEAAGGEDVVRVEFDAGDAPIPVMIDRMMLKRAFENLARNAAQALGPKGGTIWVRAERRRVTIPGAEGRPPEEVDQAWLVVEDDGPGIPPEHRAKVFDPYFTTKSDGTGLGLAIVRKIAIDHAGDMGLEERPGGGARFIFALPLRDPARRQRLSFVTFTRNG